MAKSTRKSAPTPAEIRLAQMTARLQSIDPAAVVVAGTAAKLAGLPIPFAFEYLLDLNVLPMGVVLHIYGEKDNNKTTFFWEISRICQSFGGWPELFLTEGKYSPRLISAVIVYLEENPLLQRFVHEHDNMQEWQAALLTTIKNQRLSFQKGDPSSGVSPGAYSPMCYGIDSLTGQLLKSTGDKMETEGAAEREFAIEAGALTKFLKKLATEMQNMPAVVVAINHMKVTPPEKMYQQAKKRTIGGNQIKFQATYELELDQGPQIQYLDTDSTHGLYVKGYDILITADKNSLGEKRRQILVPYRWHYETSRWGERIQRASFDWDASLAFVLWSQTQHKSLKSDKQKSALIGRMDQIIHFRTTSSAEFHQGTQFYSKTLGISKDRPVSATEFGRQIQADPELVEKLRDAFGIKRYTVWDTEECYFKLSKRLQAQIQKTASSTPKAMKKAIAAAQQAKSPLPQPQPPVTKSTSKPLVKPPAVVKPQVVAKPPAVAAPPRPVQSPARGSGLTRPPAQNKATIRTQLQAKIKAKIAQQAKAQVKPPPKPAPRSSSLQRPK